MHIKKTFFAFLALFFAVISCKKSETTTPAVVYKYMSSTSGSTWQYSMTNNLTATTTNYTRTSTTRDSTINGRAYHVFTNSSTGGSEYYFTTGNDYYNFRTLGLNLGNATFEDNYLKDNSPAGTSWAQSLSLIVPGVPFPVPITVTYTIAEKGINRTVNSIAYTDVIHISGTITSSLIPAANLTTDINNYYARKVGMIETSNKFNLNFMGITQNTDNKTILLLSDIK